MTTREEAQRAYWESKIPAEWDIIRLKDVHRAINRGQPCEQFSKKWLERQAAAGNMGAIGGPGTPLHHYRVRRSELIEFLTRLDVVVGAGAGEADVANTTPRRRGGAGHTRPRRNKPAEKKKMRRGRGAQDANRQAGEAGPPASSAAQLSFLEENGGNR